MLFTGIDAEFARLLDAIFGVDAMQAFRRKRSADWICLQAAFESRKRAANPQSPTPLNISIPFSFIEFYRKHAVCIILMEVTHAQETCTRNLYRKLVRNIKHSNVSEGIVEH